MLPKLTPQDLELTLEQQFLLVQYTQLVNEIPPEELRIALLEIARQLMVKDNVIRLMVKENGIRSLMRAGF